MGYEYIDHTADVMFRASGQRIEDAFRHAALAMGAVMIDPHLVQQKTQKRVHVVADRYETLLYEFLQEIIYFVDADEFLLHDVRGLEIVRDGSGYKLTCMLIGDTISPHYELGSAVKSVTYSEMKVFTEDGRWVAQVVLDI